MRIDIEKLKQEISKEELQEYYRFHNYKDTLDHFNLSVAAFDKLKKEYDLVKTKEDIIRTKELTTLNKFGVTNVFKDLKRITNERNTSLDLLLSNYSLDLLREEYKKLPEQAFLDKYDIDSEILYQLKTKYNFKLNAEEINSKRKCTWESKDTSYNNSLSKYANSISKKDFVDYYITTNHSFEDTTKHFNIHNSAYTLGLIRMWNCYKDKKKSYEISCETKEQRYDDKYYNNHLKTVETCNSRYGTDNVSRVPEILNKIVANRSKSIESSGINYSIDSKPNLQFKRLLEEYNLFSSDKENREFPLDNRAYDFKVGSNLIEINPTCSHNSSIDLFGNKEKGLHPRYHFEKSKLAKENGYRCIHVWDWDDVDKIISLLLPRPTCYARQCEVKHVDYYEARDFINKYHIQGDTRRNDNDIRLGLYYNNELISIMTFGKPRYNKNYQYELLRYCSSYKVTGGAEKLFKHFITDYSPESIISYCDLSKFTGNTYIKLGFNFKSESISKHWYNIDTQQHITDNLLRQRGFDQLFNTDYGKGTSNEQLMLDAGFVEIYDAGQATYTWRAE